MHQGFVHAAITREGLAGLRGVGSVAELIGHTKRHTPFELCSRKGRPYVPHKGLSSYCRRFKTEFFIRPTGKRPSYAFYEYLSCSRYWSGNSFSLFSSWVHSTLTPPPTPSSKKKTRPLFISTHGFENDSFAPWWHWREKGMNAK